MTLITKGMGAIIKSGSKKTLTTSQAHKVSKIKEKLISKIVSGPRKAYKKKFGKEPTFKMKNPITNKSKTHINHMIGDTEIQRFDKIMNAKATRKR